MADDNKNKALVSIIFILIFTSLMALVCSETKKAKEDTGMCKSFYNELMSWRVSDYFVHLVLIMCFGFKSLETIYLTYK